MKHAFISYAREDVEFVRHLAERLGERDLDVWVDLEGIHAGEEWLARIERGIDESDTFVFVISTRSAASEVCAREVAYAVRNNKRIIPIVYEDTSELLPEAVSARQWIFFRPHDAGDDAFGEVLAAITTDPGHLRAHTRLLVRSMEWDGEGRDRSRLLRGGDLEEAERWLAESSRHQEAKATETQSAFVLASRRSATRRARALTGSVTGALVIVTVLAGVAFVQRQLAEERARIALSRQLAAQVASVIADGEGDLGLLLSIEAERESPTVEARSSMLAVLGLDPPPESFFHGHQLMVRDFAITPDDRLLISAGCEVVSGLEGCARYGVRAWDLATTTALPPLSTGHESVISSIAVSPDGTGFATGGWDGTVRRWSTADLSPQGRPLRSPSFAVQELAYSPDGRLLAAATAQGVAVWSVANGSLLTPRDQPRRSVHDVAFDPTGG